MAMTFLTSIYTWMGATFLFLILFILMFIFVIYAAKKTHMVPELKAGFRGKPIALFFRDDRNVEWRAIEPEAGIIIDKDYGAFIINERGSYVDKKTKASIIPFDASIAMSVNVHAAKLLDDLQNITSDEEELKKLRKAIAENSFDPNASLDVLKTSINFSAIRNMMTALVPHNINAKIEKTIALRMKGFGNPNIMNIIFIFAAMLGAIIIGALIVRYTLK